MFSCGWSSVITILWWPAADELQQLHQNLYFFLSCRVWSTCIMTACHRLCTVMWSQTTYSSMLTMRHMLLILGLLESLKLQPSQHGRENPCQQLQALMATLPPVNVLLKNCTTTPCYWFWCVFLFLTFLVTMWELKSSSNYMKFGSWINIMNFRSWIGNNKWPVDQWNE